MTTIPHCYKASFIQETYSISISNCALRWLQMLKMASRAKMNVQNFPRPPRLENISRHIRVSWEGQDIIVTKDAYWVLETHHPPTYYLPKAHLKIELTPTARRSFCEWKGAATYYTVKAPQTGTAVSNRIWSYEQPTEGFKPIKGYVSLYAGPWDCFVDGEKVEPQPGDFYGGWVTSEIEGIVKGRTGNLDPVL